MKRSKKAEPGPLAVGAALILVVLLTGACSSSATHPSAPSSTAPASTTALASACEQVSAVLSDGPDPDADPLGYAEAQILPLRDMSVPNKALHSAVTQLAGAYQNFFTSNGKSSNAKEAVAVASSKVNSICPGAAS